MKTLKDLLAVLDGLGLPYVQIQWYPAEAPNLPYVVVVPASTDNRSADNTVNAAPVNYLVELYTRYRDMELEAQIQAALGDAGFFYQRATTVIPDGYVVLTRYSLQLFEDVPIPSS